jgi:hypothetical protein
MMSLSLIDVVFFARAVMLQLSMILRASCPGGWL